MTKIPITTPRDAQFVDVKDKRTPLNVKYLEVVYKPDGGAQIPIIFGNDHDSYIETICLLLTPPAAKQLSRALRQAVKEYLNSTPETATSSKDHSD